MLQRLTHKRTAPLYQSSLEGDRSERARCVIAGFVALLVLTMGFALQVGASDVPTLRILMSWAGFDG